MIAELLNVARRALSGRGAPTRAGGGGGAPIQEALAVMNAYAALSRRDQAHVRGRYMVEWTNESVAFAGGSHRVELGQPAPVSASMLFVEEVSALAEKRAFTEDRDSPVELWVRHHLALELTRITAHSQHGSMSAFVASIAHAIMHADAPSGGPPPGTLRDGNHFNHMLNGSEPVRAAAPGATQRLNRLLELLDGAALRDYPGVNLMASVHMHLGVLGGAPFAYGNEVMARLIAALPFFITDTPPAIYRTAHMGEYGALVEAYMATRPDGSVEGILGEDLEPHLDLLYRNYHEAWAALGPGGAS